MALTPRQEAFACGLAQGLSQAEAYRRAYPASLKWKDQSVWDAASRLAAHAEVQHRVAGMAQKAAKANEVTVERVLREIARLAFQDPRKFFTPAGEPLPLHELDDDTAAALAGFEVLELWEGKGESRQFVGYVKKYKLADKGANLERLGRHLKMFTDRLELPDVARVADELRAARKRAGV